MKIWVRTDAPDSNLYISDPTQTLVGDIMRVPFTATGWANRSKLSNAPIPGARFVEITQNKANLLTLVGGPVASIAIGDGPDPNASNNAQSTAVYGARQTIMVANNNCTATQVGRFVKLDATGKATIITATGDNAVGVLTALPDAVTAGAECEITVQGPVTFSSNSGGVDPTQFLTYTNAGVPVAMAGTDFIQSLGMAGSSTGRDCVGIALAAAGAGVAFNGFCFAPRPMIA